MNKALVGAPNPLAKLVLQPGGVTTEDAVRAAEANLESIRGNVVREIEATLERMQAIGAGLKAGPDEGALDELCMLSNALVGMAGVFGMRCLGEVARSLYTLIDRLMTAKKWDGPAVQVHVDSLRLLRPGTTGSDAEQRAIVIALQRVVDRS